MRSKTLRYAARVILPIVTAMIIFSCRKPEPEKHCIQDNALAVCPEPIRAMQQQVYCIDDLSAHPSLVLRNGKSIKLNWQATLVNGIRVKQQEIPGAYGSYNVQLTTKSGTSTSFQVQRCLYENLSGGPGLILET